MQGGSVMELGNKIAQLRQKAKWTQKQLADELGISAQSVSKWENLVAAPDIALLPKLAEVFGVSIDELFDLTIEQKLNRIENRLDIDRDLSHETFTEYEEYLRTLLSDEEHHNRATGLLAQLYGRRMLTDAHIVGCTYGQQIAASREYEVLVKGIAVGKIVLHRGSNAVVGASIRTYDGHGELYFVVLLCALGKGCHGESSHYDGGKYLFHNDVCFLLLITLVDTLFIF